MTWRGLLVSNQNWDPKHPQLTINVPPEDISVPDARPFKSSFETVGSDIQDTGSVFLTDLSVGPELFPIGKLSFMLSDTAFNTFGTWNNLRFDPVVLLDFNTGSSLGWTVTEISGPRGLGNAGGMDEIGTGDADWVDESRVSKTIHLMNDDEDALYRISGLTGSFYRIKVFPSSEFVGLYVVEMSVDGFATIQTVEGSLNTTEIAEFTDVAPVGGIIDFSWRRQSGSVEARISALQIQEISS